MTRNPLHTKLISIVEPVISSSGYELADLRFLLEQGGWTLRVQISQPLPDVRDLDFKDSVDISACENMSRELSAVLDVADPISQNYNLEVSSPGIDRPLRTARQFAYFTGSEAKIALAIPLQTPSGDRRNFKGVLQGVSGDAGREVVAIDVDGQTFSLPLADIDTAKLVPDWDAVMKGGSGHSPKAKKN